MDKPNEFYCLPEDFRDYIEDLPASTTMVHALENVIRFPEDGERLILDCVAEIWVRGAKRKYFRKVKYAHICFRLPDQREDYLIYFIDES